MATFCIQLSHDTPRPILALKGSTDVVWHTALYWLRELPPSHTTEHVLNASTVVDMCWTRRVSLSVGECAGCPVGIYINTHARQTRTHNHSPLYFFYHKAMLACLLLMNAYFSM